MKHLIRKILKENELEWVEGLDYLRPLRFKEKKIYWVDYGELERFIESVYGKEYEIAAMLESSNDTTHEFNTELLYDTAEGANYDEIYIHQENIHESEDDALDWAVEAINDDVYKWGSVKKILNDGDIISISGDICDGEGSCGLTLKDEPFIFSRNSRGVPYIRWSNDLDKRPSGWAGPSDTSKDAIQMDTATAQWDDELDVRILYFLRKYQRRNQDRLLNNEPRK